MLKHILTLTCNHQCLYCITKNIPPKTESLNILKTLALYKQLKQQDHKEIMLTGGEPTLAIDFIERIYWAKKVFSDVHLTTQNRYAINEYAVMFDSIVFSLHDLNPPIIKTFIPVYGSILANQYHKDLPRELYDLGYAGLTINEDQRGDESFNIDLPNIIGFTYKINRVGHCMNETIILPDLEVITDFSKFLGK